MTLRWRTDGRITPRDRRAVRVGALLTAPVLCHVLLVKPYLSGARRMLEALQVQRAILAREEDVMANLPAIQAEGAASTETLRSATLRMYPMTDTVAAVVALGHDVADAFNSAGVSMQHMEMRDSLIPRARVLELTVDLRAEGEFQDLVGALSRLEANRRLIRVDRLMIERSASASSAPERLSIVAVVHGYAR
jgi:Tfp pilus assembly protein PilO